MVPVDVTHPVVPTVKSLMVTIPLPVNVPAVIIIFVVLPVSEPVTVKEDTALLMVRFESRVTVTPERITILLAPVISNPGPLPPQVVELDQLHLVKR